MAHGFEEIKSGNTSPNVKSYERKPQVKPVREGKGIGSRRMFSTQFKLQVLDSYRQDSDCRGNQRATARKYGIHRRQIQKWLQMESSLRSASEGSEVALNLAGQSRQRDGNCTAGCLPRPPPEAVVDDEEEELNVDKISDSEDDVSSADSSEQEQALDFTCAALSRRRFYSLSFKLEVLDAFYNDSSCCRNQRATALKFGIHRRQIQKWLNQEGMLRAEYASSQRSSPIYTDVPRDVAISPNVVEPTSPCLDLSRKRKTDSPYYAPEPKKSYYDLDDVPSSAQETALCLVKPAQSCDVSSSLDYCACAPTYWCCDQQPFYDCWPSYTCPYACITSRLHHDAHYYKQAIKDINLYTPLYTSS